MKLLVMLFCLVFVSTGFAQQNPAKKMASPPGNVDNMPVLKDTGHAKEIPTRKGQGTAIDMPIYSGPVASDESIATFLRNVDVAKSIKSFQPDSSNRSSPDADKLHPKNRKQ